MSPIRSKPTPATAIFPDGIGVEGLKINEQINLPSDPYRTATMDLIATGYVINNRPTAVVHVKVYLAYLDKNGVQVNSGVARIATVAPQTKAAFDTIIGHPAGVKSFRVTKIELE